MIYNVEPIIIERENPGELGFLDTPDPVRFAGIVYEAGKQKNTPKISIGILAYKHIEQTKICVECVLKYAGDIDYELILLDNGSDDGDETYNYFQSVPVTRKKVIKVTHPMGRYHGSVYGTQLLIKYAEGDIFVHLCNDHYLTENALQNMIKCLDSDPSIGCVVPMSSNAFLLQNPKLEYKDNEEMFRAAKAFNNYDPGKWQERLFIALVAMAAKKEAIISTGFYDFHSLEFGLCARMHAAGYKTLLLGDTWVCHDHDYSTKTDSHGWRENSDEQYITDQRISKTYGGLSLFDDIMVFETGLINLVKPPVSAEPKILAIEVKSGQGLLDLKNKLRTMGIFKSKAFAFTTQAKYYQNLSATANTVFCDRIDFIDESITDTDFDYIIIGEPINLCANPFRLLDNAVKKLQKGGQLLFKLRNTAGLSAILKATALFDTVDEDMPVCLTEIDVAKRLAAQHYTNIQIDVNPIDLNDASAGLINILLKNDLFAKNIQESRVSLMTRDYLFSVIA